MPLPCEWCGLHLKLSWDLCPRCGHWVKELYRSKARDWVWDHVPKPLGDRGIL